MKNTYLPHPLWVRDILLLPASLRLYQTLLSKVIVTSIVVILILFSSVIVRGNGFEVPSPEVAAELVPITPILECVEDLGNGQFKAVFGYDNPNGKQVTVPKGNSRVVWYGTGRQEKVHNQFQPGIHESVLEREFDASGIEDGLTWIIRIPKRASMEASADITSTLCEPDISSIENFKAIAVSTDQIDLSWDEPTSNEPFTYTLERTETGTDPWMELASELPQSITSFSDTGLDEFTEYTYRIYAGNENATTGFATTLARTSSVLSSATNFNGKNRDKIGPKLTALAQDDVGDNPSEFIYQFDADGDVLIEVVAYKNPSTVAAVVDLLQTKYIRTDSKFILDPNTYISEDRNLIDVYFDTTRLEELNLEEIINFVRPVFRPLFGSIGETGVIYQGDSSQASLDARKSFKITRINPDTGLPEQVFIDGAGIGIGAISNSFNTQPFSGPDSRYVTDQKNLDLPGPDNTNFSAPVQVLEDATAQSSDEGRAMLQIAHDIAPGANLGFHTGLPTINKFAEAIDELSLAGYKLIVDDITFLVENFFGQYGPVYEAMNSHTVRDTDNMLFSSAGNFADHAIEGVLNFVPIPAGSDIYPDGITGYINDFGGSDLTLDIFANPGEYILVFQWDEPFSSLGDPTGAVNDLDMYVVNDLFQVEAGNNRINIEGDALELLVLRSTGAKASNLVFTCECDTPPTGLNFRMIAFKTSGDVEGSGLEFTDPISAPTVSGHAGFDLPKLITVGASFYGYYGTGAGPDLEPFSSLGAPLTSIGARNKVKITASDGGNTNVLSIGSDIMFDPDVFNNFFGTSAAAPTAAAAWALAIPAIKEWFPSGVPTTFYSDPSFATGNPTDEVTGLFLESASPVSNPDIGGAGLLRVEDALKGVAAQTPLLLDFIVEEGKVISVDTADVTLIGDYFTPGSQVTFNGESIPTTFVSENGLMVTINPFSGDAGFVVTNAAPITESMTDGGDSNPLDLLDGRRAITIVAKDTTLTFGQDFDVLKFEVEGLIGDETYESLELPEVTLTSTATGPFPDIGNYIITPTFATPLSDGQQDEFIVAFVPGVLSITPLELTIQPQDTAVTYGEIPPFVMNYIYDTTGISNNSEFLELLRSEHESTYLEDTTGTQLVNRFSAVVNRFSAVVNENPDLVDQLIELLTNSNWIATETSIENRFSAVVNGLVFDADQLIDYLTDPLVGNSASIENRFSAVVNGDELVNGSTFVWDPLENRFSAVVNTFSAVANRFSAVVNVPLGTENDSTDLFETLAIVDAEDGSLDGEPIDTVEVYSINVVTGLSVTNSPEERHFMLSGAALAPAFTNCILNFEPGLLTINPAPIVVDLDDEDVLIEINYGDSIPVFTSTTETPAYYDEINISYNLNPEPNSIDPISAGTYTVEQIASITNNDGIDVTSSYDITYINGALLVNPVTLTLNTDDVFTTEGTDLSTLSFKTTITGLVEDVNDVFPGGPIFNYTSPIYEAAGRTPGTYHLETSVTPNPDNYTVVDSGAQLFVNLTDGKKIRVYLDCIAQNNGQSEYGFTAYFHYENDNDVSVFIGPEENFLEGNSFDASGLPFELLPGSHQVAVNFEGALRWKVSSFGSTNPSSVEVNSENFNNNNRCKAKDIVINGRTANQNPESELTSYDLDKIQYYPNPVKDYLVVRVNQGFSSLDYQLYDSRGILQNINVTIDPLQSTAEFNLSNFESGLYLLKLNINDTSSIIRILRQ